MQLRSEDRAAFLRRTVVSVGLFLLLLSVGANVFLLLAPTPPATVVTVETHHEPASRALGPRAYGAVSRGVAVKPQKTWGGNALLPPASYQLPSGVLPEISDQLPLYRNQGIQADNADIDRIFAELGVILSWREMQLLPSLQRWRSADRTKDITLDIEKRALTVSLLGSFPPSAEGPADDDLALAIAREFVDNLGVTPYLTGNPSIVERVSDGQTKTYVVWPMMFGTFPLLDAEARPVPVVQVQVGRQSRRALSITLTLLRPDRLTSSDYPRATPEVLAAGFASGGLLPVATDLKGKKTDVVYTNFTAAYILLPGDNEYPMYIFPSLVGQYRQGDVTGVTYVPAIDPVQFNWQKK